MTSPVVRALIRILKPALKAVFYCLAGGLTVLVVLLVWVLQSRPDLKIWHETFLDQEFTAASPARSFEDYLSIEERLFSQIDTEIYQKTAPGNQRLINRYRRGSLSDPENWEPNWNRTFEWPADSPKAGILLLHGMSDSPYSIHHPARSLNDRGAWVIGLRLPGHGTAPSGLVRAKWEDMARAVHLAMIHLRQQVPDRPLYILGYSNGASLAVNYALDTMDDPELPRVSGLVLISPAIRVTPLAFFAVWQARLGRLLGLHKLAWNSLLPEYDPFKYGSFAVNAGVQSYRITNHIQARITELAAAGRLKEFPPVLAFQSVVDATVLSHAVADHLLARIPANGSELVYFDINRLAETERLLAEDPKTFLEALLNDRTRPFTLTLLGNENLTSRRIAIRRKSPGTDAIATTPTDLVWPTDIYSLTHVALPFPPDDSLYGGRAKPDRSRIQLGTVVFRGERGVLQIPASDMLRLRWNPFYDYLERRLLEFTRL